jgi:large conductance mechanosensitive channel
MSMAKEFKEFIARGNVMDLAVGVIMGAAFGKIVTTLVNDIIMPPLGLVLGKVDFTNLFFTLGDKKADSLKAARDAGIPVFAYGEFINVVIEFLIIAFVIFMIVKGVNKMQRKAEPPPATTKDCPMCYEKVPLKAKRCGHCTSEIAA